MLENYALNVREQIEAGNLAFVREMYDDARRHFEQALQAVHNVAEIDPVVAEIQRCLAQVYWKTGRLDEAEHAARVALEADEQFWGAEPLQSANGLLLMSEILRKKGDFERASGYLERCLALREREFGITNDQTLEVYARLIALYLESGRSNGLEDLHRQVLPAYQQCFPTGSWTNFLQLRGLMLEYVAEGRHRQAERILKTETSVLTKLLGPRHREVAALAQLAVELMHLENRHLGAWRQTSKTERLERAANEQLFLSERRQYAVPLAECRSVIERMLSLRCAFTANAPFVLHRMWWHVDTRASTPTQLSAVISYSDRSVDQSEHRRPNANLRLTVRLTNRMNQTRVDYEAMLDGSDRLTLAVDIVKFTIGEIDQTLAIVPYQLNVKPVLSASPAAPSAAHIVWPSAQQFNEAVQNPHQTFGPLELRDAVAVTNQLGLPRPCSGAMGTVYCMRAGSTEWAVKCFTEPVSDHQQRYSAISHHLERANLPYFAQFHYAPEGIEINGSWYPIVQMEWIKGTALNVFIAEHVDQPRTLMKLAEKFVVMTNELQRASIAHGDLQHGNVLVSGDSLILIDYDGMWVPQLSGMQSNELGHRNFQHPARTKNDFGLYLDNFSAWLIYCSIICVAYAPSLWEQLQGGDECLLLRKEDLDSPGSSSRFNRLLHHRDGSVRDAAQVLIKLLSLPLARVPVLASVL